MTQLPPEAFVPFAESLANVSGEIIRRYFRKPLESEEKEDATPVTIADREAEKTMRAVIHSTYPSHGVIGEEFGPYKEEAEYCWVIDPIDGTKSFMVGRPIFGTLIALLHHKKPILGIIDQPILAERWTGVSGFATYFNVDMVRTRACPALNEAILCTTSPNLFNARDLEYFEQLRKKVKYTVYGGDCYSYGLLASGFVDIVIETGLKPYDFCALSPVIKGAGGIITDWHGKDLTLASDGRVIAAGDRNLHAKILTMLGA